MKAGGNDNLRRRNLRVLGNRQHRYRQQAEENHYDGDDAGKTGTVDKILGNHTFFADLQSEDYESAIAMVHSRFATNTNPSWERAHPNRLMVHNGEINAIRGNADKMLAREENMESEHLKGQLHKVLPAISKTSTAPDLVRPV